MDVGLVGFFVGAAPGLTYILVTMFRVRQVQGQAREIARQHGEFLDFDSSENQSYDFLLSPEKFIKPTDGPGVRSGKSLLLSIRDKMWKRLWVGVVLMFVGMPIGIFSAVFLNEYLLDHP